MSTNGDKPAKGNKRHRAKLVPLLLLGSDGYVYACCPAPMPPTRFIRDPQMILAIRLIQRERDIALRGGTFARIERADAAQPGDAGEARFQPKRRGPMTAEFDGFNVQAAVRIEVDDDESRERLVRSFARPCFAPERLSMLPDGRVAYRVKYAGRGGTHRIMTPVEFLARLAALYTDDCCGCNAPGAPALLSLTVDSTGPQCGGVPSGSALGSKEVTPPVYEPGKCTALGGEPIGAVTGDDSSKDSVFTFCCRHPDVPR